MKDFGHTGTLASAIDFHLAHSVGKTPDSAALTDWRLALSRAVRDRLRRPVVQSLLGNLEHARFLTTDEAQRLAPPTLLLWGTDERVLPEACLDWFRCHLPDSVTIERPEGWGHSAHLEQTAALVRRVCRFVDSVEPQPDGESCPEPSGEAPSGG